MPHLQPVVIPGGSGVVGQSLGFHAYALRMDNLSNQWLQEASSLAWIPPYSLGLCLRLYGTAVAIILNRAPVGQPQLAPVPGEYASGFYSDELRTEVAASPVRQFVTVQAVSDLTQGGQPTAPNPGVDRLWADVLGNIHHMHADGSDFTLMDPNTVAGGILSGFYPNPGPAPQIDFGGIRATTLAVAGGGEGLELLYDASGSPHTGYLTSYSRAASAFRNLNLAGAAVFITANGSPMTLAASSLTMPAGSALANLAASSISRSQLFTLGGASSTASAGLVPSAPDIAAWTPAVGTTSIHALWSGQVSCTLKGAVISMMLGWGGGATLQPISFNMPDVNYSVTLNLHAYLSLPGAGANNFQVYWATNAGTVSMQGNRSILVYEFAR